MRNILNMSHRRTTLGFFSPLEVQSVLCLPSPMANLLPCPPVSDFHALSFAILLFCSETIPLEKDIFK